MSSQISEAQARLSNYVTGINARKSIAVETALREFEPTPEQGDIVVRFRHGTEDWKRIMWVAQRTKHKPAQAARKMMRACFTEMFWRLKRDQTD